MDFDKSILGEFITEVKEHLETVEDDLLVLEKGADDSAYADTVNKVFRAVHTVKGTAGFLGLKNMSAVAHLGETILSKLRSGELKPNSTLVDVLLGAVDTIRAMLDDVEHSNEHDITNIMARLEAILDPNAAPAAAEVPAQPPSVQPAVAPSVEADVKEAPGAEAQIPVPQIPAPQMAAPEVAPPPAIVERRKPRDGGDIQERRKEEARGDTVRIKISVLDKLMQLAGELVLVRNQQLLSKDKSDPQLKGHIQRLNIVTAELQETIIATRMQPIGNLLGKFPRIVRDLGKKLGKQVELEVSGNEVELDNTILEALSDPLTHLVRNCCDHGIESPQDRLRAGKPEVGFVDLRAYHGNGQVNIEITDDGKGIDPAFIRRKVAEKGLKAEAELAAMTEGEIVSLILLPGFSTAETLSDVSGRGVGMDVVKTSIEKLGGSLDIESHVGKGTVIRMRMPLTLAIIPSLMVTMGKHRYAIPQLNVDELVCLYDDDVRDKIESAGSREVFRLRDQLLPMVRLKEVLERGEKFSEAANVESIEGFRQAQERKQAEHLNKRLAGGNGDGKLSQSLNFVVLSVNNVNFGLIVDGILGTEEIVVKPVHPSLKSLYCFAGVTVMGDGNVALILDAQGIAKHAGITADEKKDGHSKQIATGPETHASLLFKSGGDETFGMALQIIKRIETVSPAQIEKVGGKEYMTIEGASTLIIRLEKHLNVSPCVDRNEMYLLLPKHFKNPYGLLVSTLLDTAETSIELNTESYQEEGILGTSIVKGKMTLFPDLDALAEMAEPAWFAKDKSEMADGVRNRILYVEDSAFHRSLVKKYLGTKGYVVLTAENGLDGLAKLEESEFDIVISDLQMPVMDGMHFMKNMRGNQRWKDLPAIALTAMNSEAIKSKASEAGFDRYVLKADRVGLLSNISELLAVAETAAR